MGWKKVKEYFEINDGNIIFEVDDQDIKKLMLGVTNVPDCAVFNESGDIIKLHPLLIKGYMPIGKLVERIEAEKEKFSELFSAQDEFINSLPVFWVEGGLLCGNYCEEYGYPNNTHSGTLMTDDGFFKTPMEAIKYGLQKCKDEINFYMETIIPNRQKDLELAYADLDHTLHNLEHLNLELGLQLKLEN